VRDADCHPFACAGLPSLRSFAKANSQIAQGLPGTLPRIHAMTPCRLCSGNVFPREKSGRLIKNSKKNIKNQTLAKYFPILCVFALAGFGGDP
jgi:hypothetical protein